MPRAPALYRAGVRAALFGLPLAARFAPKVARAIAGRQGLDARLTRWGDVHRDPARPLIWMHATSVGEGLHAKPVLEVLRRRQPDWQLFYTHFSPSAERFAASLDVDGRDYLPFDTARAQAAALDALRPTALVFAHLDVWPALTLAAAERRLPVALISAVVARESSRLGPFARRVTRTAYAHLDAVAAADADQVPRLLALGVPPRAIEVLGDTRYDSAAARADRAAATPEARILSKGGPLLIAGSTWPDDEAVLLEAFGLVKRRNPEVRMALAPHEPTPARLAEIGARAAVAGLDDPIRLSAVDERSAPPSFVLVDRVGILADLYAAGRFAYVGGGFGRAGLHSVLEPAAVGIPVIVGPRWHASRDAQLLHGQRALVALPSGRDASHRLAEQWVSWVEREAECGEAGGRARALVEAGRGAAERTARTIERLVRPTEVRAGE